MPEQSGLTLRELRDKPVGALRAVGARLEAQLAELGITTVLDLLEHYPRRYHDRTTVADIANLALGQEATVTGELKRVTVRRPRKGRPIVELELFDGTSYLRLTFFNQEYRARLEAGTEVSVFGRVELYRGRRQMVNPALDVLGRHGEATTGVLLPVYPQSGKAGIHSWQLRRLVAQALERTRPRGFADPLDDELRRARGLLDRTAAYWGIHQPATLDEARTARERLAFDEFLRIQVRLVVHRRAIEGERTGIEHQVDGPLLDAFLAHLPFALTGSQRRAVADIGDDLAAPAPMHRLLQGEVGSGKTVVALAALLVAVQGGYQGAFLAPTEVLAEQHELTLRSLVDGLTVPAPGSLLGDRPVRVALLTGRTPGADRRRLDEGLQRGEVDIVVGTHALLEEGVSFPRLGVAVIDEQHRFGVEQRDVLRGKGDDPDVLVMTATPIPRTAAMLLYGDLDKSELRELPAGRAPVDTELVGPSPLERTGVYDRLRREVAAGRQAYVVCPLVEGSDRVVATAATAEYERLGREELAGLRLGLLHGQLPAGDKEEVMRRFRARDLDVLVATTVIEVGVDVPNATVMVVEDADRFGLLQLHQLRGRIGRGAHRSCCFLLADPSTPEGQARLEAMRGTTDGFELAERDLEIRGAGAVFGERQSGFSDLKLGRLPRDEPVVVEARAAAERILDLDPSLAGHDALRDEFEDLYPEDAAEFLFKS
ncbi:MAG TPA: ATP-dependent DNA helicase RecG [Acidimicrobiia bacterium]|nr:ATP-dependent DNA helicase RecG [Acidimicrobiia bacterium]